jgi:chromosome segregation ATPase
LQCVHSAQRLPKCLVRHHGKIGHTQRNILADRVESARDSQQEAKEQFKSTLEQFSALTNFNGGDLEASYKRLNSEFEDSEAAAEAVNERIQAVENVAKALFNEWQDELDIYTNKKLRASSERQLRATKQRYGQLLSAMQRAESKIDPVLAVFRDQVLFLKHNLTADRDTPSNTPMLGRGLYSTVTVHVFAPVTFLPNPQDAG